jgi:hypothetical protein
MFYLKRNLPTTERLIRASLGLCAGVATATLASTTWAMIAGYASAVALAGTAIVGFCPACALFG